MSALETEASNKAAPGDPMPAYREPTRSTDPTGEDPMSDADRARLAALEAENERLKTEAAAIAAANAATLQATRHATHAAFAEQLCVAGTLLPAHKPTVIAIMDRVAEGAAIAFGEGDKKTEKPALVAFQEFLQALPKQVDFSERAGGKAQTDIDTEDSADLAKRAIEFVEAEAKAGRQVSIATAVTQLAAQAAAAS
ncbi:MAG: hypothetical protein B7Z52_06980 [Burkholderiales bacterium 12-64-5]|nr:MAG: hypothetical protein B7Z52_06980 [Burkholderiales bacterium 12-64-5]